MKSDKRKLKIFFQKIADVQTAAILTIAYYILIPPYSLAFFLIRLLQTDTRSETESGWKQPDPSPPLNPDVSFRKQY